MDKWLEDLTNPIEIEIGKTYVVQPCYKKSVLETSFYRKGEKQVINTTTWRSGSRLITPQDEDERESLDDYQRHGGFEPFYFEENEFVECWDGCAEDQEFYGIDDEDEQEMLREAWYDHGHGYFEDNGWDELDPEVIFEVPVLCEVWNGSYADI